MNYLQYNYLETKQNASLRLANRSVVITAQFDAISLAPVFVPEICLSDLLRFDRFPATPP